MFTSNNSYSYPQLLPPSLHIPSLTHPFDLLHHQQPSLQDGHLFQPASAAAFAGAVNMVVSAKAAFDNQSIMSNLNTEDCDPLSLRHTKKRKDRHRKIVTAQGPRDRRVRLSIEISRKFFALQDMLGFDKASKTLDWLLNKSRTAVKDLIQMKHGGGSTISKCELLIGTDGFADAVDLQRMVFGDASKGKKKRQTCKTTVQLLARESRAKARARARERTKAKMKAKKMKETMMLSQSHHSSSQSMPNQSKCLKLISDLNSNNLYPPSNLGNWGINTSSITYRGFTALTNMNPSTVLQICSKPWEIYKLHNE